MITANGPHHVYQQELSRAYELEVRDYLVGKDIYDKSPRDPKVEVFTRKRRSNE